MKVIIKKESAHDTNYPVEEDVTIEFNFENNSFVIGDIRYYLPDGIKIKLGE